MFTESQAETLHEGRAGLGALVKNLSGTCLTTIPFSIERFLRFSSESVGWFVIFEPLQFVFQKGIRGGFKDW